MKFQPEKLQVRACIFPEHLSGACFATALSLTEGTDHARPLQTRRSRLNGTERGSPRAPRTHPGRYERMLGGVVGRGGRNSSVNHSASRARAEPRRPGSRPSAAAELSGIRSPNPVVASAERSATPAADFLQSVTRQFVVPGRNSGVRKECDGLEWASGLRKGKKTKTDGQ